MRRVGSKSKERRLFHEGLQPLVNYIDLDDGYISTGDLPTNGDGRVWYREKGTICD